MKLLNQYIFEKLKIDKDIHISKGMYSDIYHIDEGDKALVIRKIPKRNRIGDTFVILYVAKVFKIQEDKIKVKIPGNMVQEFTFNDHTKSTMPVTYSCAFVKYDDGTWAGLLTKEKAEKMINNNLSKINSISPPRYLLPYSYKLDVESNKKKSYLKSLLDELK